MKKNITLAAFIVTAIIFASCNKPILPGPECDITVANITGTYMVSVARYKVNATAAETDYMDELFNGMECRKDDLITYEANGNLTVTDAGVLCTPPTSHSDHWTLTGNKITVEQDEVATVLGIQCRNKLMTLKYTDVETDGDELIVILRKQ